MRRRYRYNEETKQMEEISTDWEPTPRTELMTGSCYEGARATDGTRIDTRRRHTDYMRQHNLAMADDFKGTWESAKKDRERIRTGAFDREARRDAIQRAIYRSKKP